MKRMIATVALSLIISLSFGQSTPVEMTKKFFDIYKQGDTDKALDYLYSNAIDVYLNQETIKWQIKKKLEVIGKYYGNELLTKKTAGPNTVMFTYIVRHHVEPLTFRITYYKADETWTMLSFRFSDKIVDELEEASKPYRIKENIELRD
jgi:hypothetical protein